MDRVTDEELDALRVRLQGRLTPGPRKTGFCAVLQGVSPQAAEEWFGLNVGVTDVYVYAGVHGGVKLEIFKAGKDDEPGEKGPPGPKRPADETESPGKRLAVRPAFDKYFDLEVWRMPSLVGSGDWQSKSQAQLLLLRLPWMARERVRAICCPEEPWRAIAMHLKPKFVERLLQHPRPRDLADMIINEFPPSVRQFPDWPPDSFMRRAREYMRDFPERIPFSAREAWMREKDDGQVICVGRRDHLGGGFIYQFIWYACWGVRAAGAQRPLQSGRWSGGCGFSSFHEDNYALVEIPDVDAWCYHWAVKRSEFHLVDGYLGDLEFAMLSAKHGFVVSTGRGFYHDMLYHVRINGSPRYRCTVDNLKLAIETYTAIRSSPGFDSDCILEFALGLHADTCSAFDPEKFSQLYALHYPPTSAEPVHAYRDRLKLFADRLDSVTLWLAKERDAYQYVADYIIDWLLRLPECSIVAVVCTEQTTLDLMALVLCSPFSARPMIRDASGRLRLGLRAVELARHESIISAGAHTKSWMWIDPDFQDVEYKGVGYELTRCLLGSRGDLKVPHISDMTTYTQSYYNRRSFGPRDRVPHLGIGAEMMLLKV